MTCNTRVCVYTGRSAQGGLLNTVLGSSRLEQVEGTSRPGQVEGSSRPGQVGGTSRPGQVGGTSRLGRAGGAIRLGQMHVDLTFTAYCCPVALATANLHVE